MQNHDALSQDALINAVHALVRHLQGEGPDADPVGGGESAAVQENVRILARWLDEPNYMRDYLARRPARNNYAAELYREWAQLDADDRDAALEVRAIDDAFEVYSGPLGWEEFVSKWYAAHADPDPEPAASPPAGSGEQADPWSEDCPF